MNAAFPMTTPSAIHQVKEPGTRESSGAPPPPQHGVPWHKSNWTVRQTTDWLHLERVIKNSDETRCAAIGAPGLWRRIEWGNQRFIAFDFPRWVLRGAQSNEDDSAEDSVEIELMSRWAAFCLNGDIDTSWRPPAPDWIKPLLQPRTLTVHAGRLVRQCELVTDANRWALRFVLTRRVDGGIGPTRLRALALLAADTMRLWEMVRVGPGNAANNGELVAEVDLTGAPHNEKLFTAAAEVLSHAVARVVETADLLADPLVDLQSLNDCWFEP